MKFVRVDFWLYLPFETELAVLSTIQDIVTVLSHSHFAWLAKLVRKSYHQGILCVSLSVGHHRVSPSINNIGHLFFTFIYTM
jgi:hypothetical protein